MRSPILKHCAGRGYNTPLHQGVTDHVVSAATSKTNQNDGKYSALNKEKVAIESSDGSSATQFTKQTDKENGKQKFKQYNVLRDANGNVTMQIDVKTNTGKDRRRTITNPDKIERKLERVLKRNEM